MRMPQCPSELGAGRLSTSSMCTHDGRTRRVKGRTGCGCLSSVTEPYQLHGASTPKISKYLLPTQLTCTYTECSSLGVVGVEVPGHIRPLVKKKKKKKHIRNTMGRRHMPVLNMVPRCVSNEHVRWLPACCERGARHGRRMLLELQPCGTTAAPHATVRGEAKGCLTARLDLANACLSTSSHRGESEQGD